MSYKDVQKITFMITWGFGLVMLYADKTGWFWPFLFSAVIGFMKVDKE